MTLYGREYLVKYCQWLFYHENVNVDKLFEIGSSLLNKMKGKNVFNCSFKRSDKFNPSRPNPGRR